MSLSADIKALFEAFKSASQLPSDVVWRTINGARVAISPRSGMVMAGPEALYGRRLNRGPVKIMHEGKQLTQADVERIVDTMTVDDVRKIEQGLRVKALQLTRDYEEQSAQSMALDWAMKAAENGLPPEAVFTEVRNKAVQFTRRNRSNDMGAQASAFIRGDDPFAVEARKAYEDAWQEAQPHLARRASAASDPFIRAVEQDRAGKASSFRTPRVYQDAVRDDFNAEEVIGYLKQAKEGDRMAAARAATRLSTGSADGILSMVREHPIPSAKTLAAYAEGDRDAKKVLRRGREQMHKVSVEHSKRALKIDNQRDEVMRDANRINELKRVVRKGEQAEGVMGRHWGAAESTNNTAVGIAFSGGQQFRPIDRDMRNTTITASLSTGALGVLRRRYAKNQLAKVPIEQEPALHRGMSLANNVVENLLSGRTKSIRLTGATAFGMSEDVARHYATSEHTQTTNTASQLREGTRPVIIRLARNETVDRSIGMYHPWHKASQDVRSMGFREAPAYEVVSDLSRVKVSKIEDHGGVLYIDVEAP